MCIYNTNVKTVVLSMLTKLKFLAKRNQQVKPNHLSRYSRIKMKNEYRIVIGMRNRFSFQSVEYDTESKPNSKYYINPMRLDKDTNQPFGFVTVRPISV